MLKLRIKILVRSFLFLFQAIFLETVSYQGLKSIPGARDAKIFFFSERGVENLDGFYYGKQAFHLPQNHYGLQAHTL